MTPTSSEALAPTACPRESALCVQRSNVVKQVGIILYEGFSLLSAGTLAEALQAANDLQSKNSDQSLTYRVNLVSPRGGAVLCSSSMSVWTEHLAARHVDSLDILFIPGGSGVARASADDNLIDLLRLVCARSVRVAAIGNGHMVLSAAGVTRRDWPSLKQDIHLKSSSASAPEHDRDQALMTSLALLKTDLGLEFAVRVADRLGSGGHHSLAPAFEETDAKTLTEKAHASARWLAENCTNSLSVGDAARRSSMSERNFLRLFKREIGVTPSKYLLRARIDLTCKMLANSDLPVDKIARRTGLSNGERLSKLFRKELSMSPTEFRARSRRKS
ncbi:helix-turn-helix domain-containing protein [Paraburkholderia sp. BCC1876]|uniref:GlxA family transcriptional regulator n=1 Tax=Paraburkholderia sp. BCC1876 TaxID=2676303 RepID=UPI001591BD96|nr:helix-turn-helix domain-containing protein [Paraburkholderia sp. BCC1876]